MRLAAIKPPQLRTAKEGSDRTATWLELFYDLLYVVAVAVLGVRLLHDTSRTISAPSARGIPRARGT